MQNGIDDLICIGYADVHALDELRYTNGVTYTFAKGMYFACRKEKYFGPVVIYNSRLAKLGEKCRDVVCLTFISAITTSSKHKCPTQRNDTSIEIRAMTDSRIGKKTFNYIKVQASIDARRTGISIHETCGAIPIFTHPVPSSQVSHYKVELKEMRDRLITGNQVKFSALEEAWREICYPDGGLGDNKQNWTRAQYAVVRMFEIRNTDGAIRRKGSDKILGLNTKTLTNTIKTTVVVSILRHRAYMWTWMAEERRTHQIEIDHIDGNTSNNYPWNLRWVSVTDNQLAKHSGMGKHVQAHMDIADASRADLGVEEWNGWKFYPNKVIERPNGEQFIARARPDEYPVIGVTIKDPATNELTVHRIKCHRIVAYLFLELPGFNGTYFEFRSELKRRGLVVRHYPDEDKNNYNTNNLVIGTFSENAHDRHDNPVTTSRKRVAVKDLESGKDIKTFASQTEAAEWFGSCVSQAICINRSRSLGTYRATKNKKTGVKYAVVDAV